MRFAPEGYLPAAVVAAVGVAAGLAAGWAVGLALLVFALAVLLFFRDPQRRAVDAGPGSILAPADGRVVSVGTAQAHRLCGEARQRISIFMSPLDVHVNRSPLDGTVEDSAYRHGRFGAAYKGDASAVNESNALLIRADAGYRVVVVQIAGWLARRIVCDVRGGDRLVRGDRFGLIMFGSRVDLHLPEGVSIRVAPGDRVKAGASILAEASPMDAGNA